MPRQKSDTESVLKKEITDLEKLIKSKEAELKQARKNLEDYNSNKAVIDAIIKLTTKSKGKESATTETVA